MITINDIQSYFNNKTDANLNISATTKIMDLSLDSLELLELIMYLESNYAVQIKFSTINGQMSIQEFIERMNQQTEKPYP
ncbi:hypothetical protein FACS189413_10130 [Bacteroidia bacterium]|nr:hypothetical protein FACS189413_10130 [Bacteroidia bacterium]